MAQIARSPKQFGSAIQQARLTRALTQSQLAALVGTGQKTVSLIENGQASTRIGTIFALLAALDLELAIAPRSSKGTTIGDIF